MTGYPDIRVKFQLKPEQRFCSQEVAFYFADSDSSEIPVIRYNGHRITLAELGSITFGVVDPNASTIIGYGL